MCEVRWQELTEDECRRLLGERHLGRLALVDADGSVILPVNYTLDGGAVVFRTDPGSKLDAAAAGATVAFEVAAARRPRSPSLPTSNGCVLPLYPWASGADARYVRIRPASVTGRRIALPADLPFTWWG